MTTTPKVFISHSWNDKERFVTHFAKDLRRNGIDAWVDEWEMLPGDSLVKKIFCEGIEAADAFIIVLSENSINKAWVLEELDAAVVKKLEEGSRIIPIILDACEVPRPLKSTIWVKVNDPFNYQDELARITQAIFGVTSKPPLGSPPAYVSTRTYLYTGLNEVDSIIFTAIGERAVEQESEINISARETFGKVRTYDIEEGLFLDALSILNHNGFIDLKGPLGMRTQYNLTDYGLGNFISKTVPEFAKIEKEVILALVNTSSPTENSRIDFGSINNLYLHYVLRNLSSQRLIGYVRTQGGSAVIMKISPVLKRVASEKYD